jgi:hypothetical protein
MIFHVTTHPLLVNLWLFHPHVHRAAGHCPLQFCSRHEHPRLVRVAHSVCFSGLDSRAHEVLGTQFHTLTVHRQSTINLLIFCARRLWLSFRYPGELYSCSVPQKLEQLPIQANMRELESDDSEDRTTGTSEELVGIVSGVPGHYVARA